jgi:hypothetical protein
MTSAKSVSAMIVSKIEKPASTPEAVDERESDLRNSSMRSRSAGFEQF